MTLKIVNYYPFDSKSVALYMIKLEAVYIFLCDATSMKEALMSSL